MNKRVTRAKIEMMLSTEKPFWGALVSRLELREWDQELFATNGQYIFVPPKRITDSYSDEEIVGLLSHETAHCAFGHVFRIKSRDPMKWNIAADFAVNQVIAESGYTLPDGVLLDKKWAGMIAEEIYAKLPDPLKIQISIDLMPPGGGNSDEKKDTDSSAIDVAELAQEWKDALVHAAQIAKEKGKLPAGLEDLVGELIASKVPWQQVLFRYLQTTKGNTDFTAYPFDRRHVWREVYLPSMQGESIELCCAIDTSGSRWTKEDLISDLSELRGIASTFGSYIIHLWFCDAKIHGEDYIITEDSDIPNFRLGGGGTSFIPVFKRMKELELDSLPLVYFTDLYGDFPKEHKDDTFWLVRKENAKQNVPFGTIIEVDN